MDELTWVAGYIIRSKTRPGTAKHRPKMLVSTPRPRSLVEEVTSKQNRITNSNALTDLIYGYVYNSLLSCVDY